MVWKEGMPDWVEAGELPELEEYFSKLPLGKKSMMINFTEYALTAQVERKWSERAEQTTHLTV